MRETRVSRVQRGGIRIRKRIEDRCLQEGGVTCALAVQDKAVLEVRHPSHSQAARRRNEYARHSSESDVCVAQSRYFSLSQPLLYIDVLSRDITIPSYCVAKYSSGVSRSRLICPMAVACFNDSNLHKHVHIQRKLRPSQIYALYFSAPPHKFFDR